MVSKFSEIDNISNDINNKRDNIEYQEQGSLQYSILNDNVLSYTKDNKIESKNILNMKIYEIVEEASDVFSNLQKDYFDKVEQIYLENKQNNIDNKTIINNIKMYFLALVHYLKEKNNLLYIGILLLIISFLLCLFKT